MFTNTRTIVPPKRDWTQPIVWEPCFSSLSSRAKNILWYYGIKTPEQLATVAERDLLRYHNCGRKVTAELRIFLQERGLDFADPVESKIQALEREVRQLKARIKELEG